MDGQNGVLGDTKDTLDQPVQRQGGRHGKADPQGHEGHHNDHHEVGRIGLLHGLLVLNAVLVRGHGVVHLLADEHGGHLAQCGEHGQQEQAPIGPGMAGPVPEGEAGDHAQVHPQEIKAHRGDGNIL